MILDRYVHPSPAEGWPRWVERNLDEAKFVLMVCTEIYARRVLGPAEPGKDLGVLWQGGPLTTASAYGEPGGVAVHPHPPARRGAHAHPRPSPRA